MKTSRLQIKPISHKDAEALFNYRKDKEANKYQGWVPESLTEAQDYIARLTKKMNTPDTWFQMGVYLIENNKLIGDIGIHFIGPQNQQVELGITIDKNFHKKGYAKEALSEVVRFLFNELNKHRIYGSIDKDNIASLAMMESLGFRKEAHFKKSYFFKGEWVDDVIYGLLQEEWRNRQ